ncbi:MAG: PQQ-binding-like beta-propeller repeat protein [Acidobacteria bacterium]|nr:PQQ-binding-like beta-propeller repeat protein [Acidobacteriota bacterium]
MKVVAIDAATGREIWKFDPSGGAASTARFRHRGVTVNKDRVFVTYTINGKQFVVIVCGGGKNGAPSGSAIVAFALP